MDYESYLQQLETTKSLSEVKKTILNRLWTQMDISDGWVNSDELLNLTKQKYFDRRIRELRDEHGCNIETTNEGTDYKYRLCSYEINPSNPRLYLSAKEKKELFEDAKFTCAVCGKKTDAGPRGLQADHKVPLIRGGGHKAENWQSLCSECNIAKRRSCQGCEADCLNCEWAFPNDLGIKYTVNLDAETFDAVSKLVKDDPNWLEAEIKKLVKKTEI